MTNPVAFALVFLLGIAVLATLAVVLIPLLGYWIVVVFLLLAAGVFGWFIAPPRRE
jgi:hypothetical protein